MEKYSVFDIANWFLNKMSVSPKKLQKLVYYSEAWSNALYDEELISDTVFEAWAHGPVSPELYQKYKEYGWKDIDVRETSNITDPKVLDLLESVWLTYGDLSANELEALTHQEDPWRRARAGYPEGSHCEVEISKHDMKVYYKSIYSGD